MAGVVFLIGLSSVLSCVPPVYLYLKPRKQLSDDDASDAETELQNQRNLVSAYWKADLAQQALLDEFDENQAEDDLKMLSLRRGKNYYKRKYTTPCLANFHDLKMKVDCGRNGISQFKLSQDGCGAGYKYEYTCLEGINAKVFEDIRTTPKVLKAGLGTVKENPVTEQEIIQANTLKETEIDLRTMYRHNVRCDLGGFQGTNEYNSSEFLESGGQTPLSEFRYDFVKSQFPNDQKYRYRDSTQYMYKCLATPTTGDCQRYESPSGVLRPEDLVSDRAMGLQGMEVKCPGENQVITRFQLKAGGKNGEISLPPLPEPGGKTMYGYEYTCCNMKSLKTPEQIAEEQAEREYAERKEREEAERKRREAELQAEQERMEAERFER